MKKSSIIIFGIVALASIITVSFLFFVAQKPEQELQPVSLQEPKRESIASGRDRFLQSFRKTGVQDLNGPYKKVTVSDGEVTFFFEVPDEWLIETRNSGEVPMTEAEMREFFKTKYEDGQQWGSYWDFTDEQVDEMSYEKLKNLFEEKKSEYSPGYPNASVSAGKPTKAIWYTDWNAHQIDFYIISTIDAEKNIEKLKQRDADDFKYYSQHSRKTAEMLQIKWEEKKIDGMSSQIAHYPLEILQNGERVTEAIKGRPGGKSYFINIGEKTLLVHKQAYAGGEFEKEFENLISTFQLEK